MKVQRQLLFLFGVGYSAERLARRAIASGWRVAGTVRSAEKAEQLNANDIDAVVWAGGEWPAIPDGAHLVISVPPNENGCRVVANQPQDTIRDVLGMAGSVTYLSTSGVYGDLAGGWAFEWTSVNPASKRGRARALAETQWLGATGGAARLVRLPGIYGPGRSVFDRLRTGRAHRRIKPGQVFSRIHVDDIESGLWALLERPEIKEGVFHLCDDEPAPPQDVTAFAAALAGLPIPPDEPFDVSVLTPMAASFYSECKRLSNARTKSALQWGPRYTNYRQGLAAIYETEKIYSANLE